MKNSKIGTLFIVSILALAGIGISYAGYIDIIYISGTVSTGTVDIEVDNTKYSGTWVWKVWGEGIDNETYITHNINDIPDDYPNYELISYSKGRDITATDPPGYDAVIEFHNLFPCIDFMADIVFHYKGSIPAKITAIDYDWIGSLIDLNDNGQYVDFIDYLIALGIQTDGQYGLTYGLYKLDTVTGLYDIPIDIGHQLHYCDEIKLIVTIHLPQNNKFQNLAGYGYVKIEVLQWNDLCEEEEGFDIEIMKIASDETPLYNVPFTYTITAHNLGPGDATGVVVNDLLPPEVDYITHNASKGTFDNITGDWIIGDLAAGETETLVITVEIQIATQIEYTQLALLLDGSTSILPAEWQIMLDGLALAVINGYIPHNGHVELTVIQFGGWENNLAWAQLELLALGGPVVLTNDNYMDVANAIQAIPQISEDPDYGGTAMSCAFHLAADVMSGDTNDKLNGTAFEGYASNHSDWLRQVVNLVTDGQPNIIYNDSNRYYGEWPGNNPPGQQFVLGKIDTELALDYFLSIVPIVEAEGDEIDVEAVGDETDIPWLRDNIVLPQPGYDGIPPPPEDTGWPPAGPGWVRYVADYTEFANTIQEKFQVIFQQIENCAVLISPDDINPDNDQDCVIIIPEYGDN